MHTFSPFNFPANIILAVVITLVIVAAYLGWSATREFGNTPSGERLKRIETSPQYDKQTQTFKNENPRDFQKDMPVFKMLRELVFGGQVRTPTSPLPSQKPDLAYLLADDGEIARLTWLGHSCILMRLGGKTILFDPTLTERVSPVSFFGNRFQPAPLQLEELPAVDYIVISHDHYDHLDANSMRFFAKPANDKTRFIAPLGVGARLESFGVAANRITELDWWESFEDQGLQFTATPSQHFSGRSIGDNGKTLWAGFAIKHANANLFFSGDSGYHHHFKAIGQKLGPFDFAILESGQYNVWWRYVHMLPAEVIKAAHDLKTKVFMPIHWGMFNLALHDWFEPVSRVSALAKERHMPIRTPSLGEVVEFGSRIEVQTAGQNRWWEQHPDFIARVKKSRE